VTGDAPSDAFEEAVRHRASGVGLVPIGLIKRLTPAEWGQIRVLTQGEARRLMAIYDAAPPIASRTKTPTMDSSAIDRLLKEVEHGH